jgi:hypothetical protein
MRDWVALFRSRIAGNVDDHDLIDLRIGFYFAVVAIMVGAVMCAAKEVLRFDFDTLRK